MTTTSQPATQQAATRKRILVVDDQSSTTRLVKLYLEGTHKYEVKELNDPTTALATAEAFHPHLIILDVVMPRLDGRELAATLQASPKLAGVPLVFLTSAVTKGEIAAQGGRYWGVPSLSKPIVLADMVECLKTHLGE